MRMYVKVTSSIYHHAKRNSSSLLLLLRKSLHFRICEREREGVEGGEGSETRAGDGGGERHAERVGKGLRLCVGERFLVNEGDEPLSRRQGYPQKEN